MKRKPKLPSKPDGPLLMLVLAMAGTVLYLELSEVQIAGFISNVIAEIFVISALRLDVR